MPSISRGQLREELGRVEFLHLEDAEFFIQYCRDIYDLWMVFGQAESYYHPHAVILYKREPFMHALDTDDPKVAERVKGAFHDARGFGRLFAMVKDW